MTLPAYWWLLTLMILGQGCFLLAITILRMRGKGVQPLSPVAALSLLASGVAGLAYGIVQSDPLIVVGQICLFFIYYMIQCGNDEKLEE